MRSNYRKIDSKFYPLLAFFFTVSIFYLAFFVTGFVGGGSFMIARSDLIHQYLAYINMFGQVLRGNGSYWFSWYSAMGSGTAFEYANVALSPFNIIFYVLGENHLMTAVTLVILLKTGTAAMTYQLFASRFLGNKSFGSVLFGVMYALCGFSVCYYVNIMWLDAVLLFPLLVLCLKRLIEDKKFLGLTFGLIYLFGVNFYAAYMAGIGLLLFFVAYLVYSSKLLGAKECFKICGKFFLAVLLALGVTAVIWLPAALRVIGDGRSDVLDAIKHSSGNNILFAYGNLMMGQNQTINGIIPLVYCGLPSLFLAHLYFFNRRIPCRERLTSGILLLFLFTITAIPVLNIAIHGFDIPNMFNYRYSYIISFLIVSLACRQSIYLKKTNLWLLASIVIFNLGLYLLFIYLMPHRWPEKFNLNSYSGLIINFIFMVLWFILAAVYKNKTLKRFSLIIMICLVLFSELLVNTAISILKIDHISYDSHYFGILSEAERNTIKIMKEKDGGWYRADYRGLFILNSGVRYGFQTLDFFTSARSSAIVSMFSYLGYYAVTNAVFRAGQTDVVNALMAVKYKIDGFAMAEDAEIAYQPIILNDYYLGPAYMVDADIMDVEFEIAPFDNQELLLTAMLGREAKVYLPVPANLYALKGTATLFENGYIIIENEVGEAGGHFRFEIPADIHNRRLFAYLERANLREILFSHLYTPDMIENNEFSHGTPRLDQPRILELGVGESGHFELDIKFPHEDYMDYFSKAEFRFYDDMVFAEIIEELSQEQLSLTDWGAGYLKGEITVSGEREILFTSLPYDKSWKVFVNGEETDIIPLLNEALCGIRLDAGMHEIAFIYEPRGEIPGVLISIAFILILCILCCFAVKKQK